MATPRKKGDGAPGLWGAFDALSDLCPLPARDAAAMLNMSLDTLRLRAAEGHPPALTVLAKRHYVLFGDVRAYLRESRAASGAPMPKGQALDDWGTKQQRADLDASYDAANARDLARRSRARNISTWLAEAWSEADTSTGETWLFRIMGFSPFARPVDVFDAYTRPRLDGGAPALTDEEEAAPLKWLTLGEYLDQLQSAASGAKRDARNNARERQGTLRKVSAAERPSGALGRDRPRS